MDDLIERLKAATEGTAELDLSIAEIIEHWVVPLNDRQRAFLLHEAPEQFDGAASPGLNLYFSAGCCHWTTCLDAAVTLMPEGLEWDVSFTRVPNSPPGQAIVYVKPFWGSSDHDRDARFIGEATTPALALCIAALMARATGDAG